MALNSRKSNYIAITNIPCEFRTADLRSYFSEYVESGAFLCFHYRHRPEKNGSETNKQNKNVENSKTTGINTWQKRCCVVKIQQCKTSLFLARYNSQNWVSSNGEYLSEICEISTIEIESCSSSIPLSTTTSPRMTNAGRVPEDSLSKMPEMNPPQLMPQGNVGTPTSIFLDLIQQCLLPHNLIQKLNLKFPSCMGQRLYSNVGFQYNNQDKEKDSAVSNQNWFDTGVGTAKIAVLSAQNKRQVFPLNQESVTETNDSTPTTKCSLEDNASDHESDTIMQCNSVNPGDMNCQSVYSENSTSKTSTFETRQNPTTAKDEQFHCNTRLSSLNLPSNQESNDQKDVASHNTLEKSQFKKPDESLSNQEIKRRKLEDKKLTQKLMAEGIEEGLISIDKKYRNDDDAEEWDRHEASEDDPTNQGRCKERLYEEEIEQPWEKGGPGVVFWTDAIFWQAKEGDFDEQTTDDLDVDFSAYDEPGAGDKDIKDFLKIRQEQRWRNGIDGTDRFSIGIGKRIPNPPSHETKSQRASVKGKGKHSKLVTPGDQIGAFEKHTKGIGRKVMEKQGWREGQGLGSTKPGITQALKGEGKKPFDKQGLGFVNAKPVRYGIPPIGKTWTKGPRPITTIYDDPEIVDPKDPLLMRGETSKLKHRQSHMDGFKTDAR